MVILATPATSVVAVAVCPVVSSVNVITSPATGELFSLRVAANVIKLPQSVFPP